MPAIITKQFRINNAANLLAESNLYVGVGKSDSWGVNDSTWSVVPSDTDKTVTEALLNLVALKKIDPDGKSHLIPRIDFISGSYYKQWDSSDDTCLIGSTDGSLSVKPCYSINNNRVYKCIRAPRNSSGVRLPAQNAPTGGTDPGDVVTSADNYIWVYMYSILAGATFNTREFIEVPVSNVGTLATDGKIYGYRIVNGGTGYSSPTLTVDGNGTGATLVAVVSGGQIVAVSTIVEGSGYTNARVVVTGGGGTGAVIEPIVSPLNGHGSKPVEELGGFYAGFAVDFAGSEDADLPVTNDFRQITLIRGISALDVDSTSGYASGLKKLTLTGLTGSITPDMIIEHNVTGGAKAFIDHVDVNDVYYHQNYSTLVNFKDFADGDNLIFRTSTGILVGGASATVDSIDSDYPEIDKLDCQVLFLEDRRPIARNASQTEEIKLIVQF